MISFPKHHLMAWEISILYCEEGEDLVAKEHVIGGARGNWVWKHSLSLKRTLTMCSEPRAQGPKPPSLQPPTL